MTANQPQTRTLTPSVIPGPERTSDVFSHPPSASPFDQNSKLWESIMPAPKPALHAVVRRKVGALSDALFQLPVADRLSTLAGRLPDAVPGWRRLSYAKQWLILTAGGMALAFTLTWSLSRGDSERAVGVTATHAAANDNAAHAGVAAANDNMEPAQTAHALKPAAAIHAMPVAVSTPEPEATPIATSSIANPRLSAPAELEPRKKRVTKAKSSRASKKKLAKARARALKARAAKNRTASR